MDVSRLSAEDLAIYNESRKCRSSFPGILAELAEKAHDQELRNELSRKCRRLYHLEED